MAKRTRSSRRPQPKHKKQKKSQHDKRRRLGHPNPKRKKTTKARVPLSGAMQKAVSVLQAVMDRRIAFRLAIVIAGMFLADDRRTASAWFAAAGVQEDWDRFYDCLIRVGRTSEKLAIDVPELAEKYGWEFRTKHQLGVELSRWFMQSIRELGLEVTVWLAADGAYAARPFLLPVLELGMVVVSRLRKDACLFDLPPEGSHGNRIYGKNKISLAKRAGHRQGWQTITYRCRGVEVTRQYKTFLATSQLVSGRIRVVILRFEDGSWAPYFCTDTSAEVRDILEAVAARWAIEEQFHDVKEVWGAGQQQVRNAWSNIGCWHLNQWLYTLVELCCWDVSKSELTDRRARPWDNSDRRPSHADRRRSISREMLQKQFLATLHPTPNNRKFHRLFKALLDLAV